VPLFNTFRGDLLRTTRDRLSGKWKAGQLQIEELHKLWNWDCIFCGFKWKDLQNVR